MITFGRGTKISILIQSDIKEEVINMLKKLYTLLIYFISLNIFVIIGGAYAEDIILTGNQIMTIENTTFTQTGNIFVRDNAKLILKNATLIINQRYHEEFCMWVTGSGKFEVINSVIDVSIPGENFGVTFLDNSEVFVENSDLEEGKVYFDFGIAGGIGPYPEFSGTAVIQNSKLHSLGFSITPTSGGRIRVSNSNSIHLTLRFRDNYEGTFSDLKPGLFASWHYKQGNWDISLEGTTINVIVVACDGPSQITIYNSEIFQFSSCAPIKEIKMKAVNSKIRQVWVHGLSSISAQFWNLKRGWNNYLKLSDHASCDSLPEIILENTEVLDWWGLSAFNGSTISIGDSFIEFRSYGGGNHVNISNSEVVELMLYATPNSLLIFDNTIIRRLNVYVPPNSIVIKGTITFPDEAKISNWYPPSRIKRNYPIHFLDKQGNTISNATLHLYDKYGGLVWTGATDQNGISNFDIEFNDNNYLDMWKLEINYGGGKINKEIKLLSSTPIYLYYPDIEVIPPLIEFGSVSMGSSVDKVATIKNNGNGDLIIGNITLPNAPFFISTDNCSGQILASGRSCTLAIRFSPDSYGSFNSNFNIPSNDPDRSLITVVLVGSGTKPITLLAPQNNTIYTSCSLFSIPVFMWDIGEFFNRYEIQFSADKDFSKIPVKLKVSKMLTQITIPSNEWKKVLLIPGTSGGTVYWRVVGFRTNRTTAMSEINSIIVEPARAIINPILSSNRKNNPPTLSWMNNCNIKFKVWFGIDEELTKKTAISLNIKNPNENSGVFEKNLTEDQWMRIRKLVGDVSGSTIFWYVEAWDGLKRYSRTDVMSFILID